eukprot:COSAG06_NODE_353_length_16899_cov_14.694345_18_plen_384_part_00
MADAVLEMVTNPSASDADDLATDSDVVLCVPPLLVRYGTTMMGKPPVLWVCLATNLVFFLFFVPRNEEDLANPLDVIAGVCQTLSIPLQALALFSFRRVTREDGGQLAELGMGRVMISASAAAHLRRWGVILAVLTSFAVLGGGGNSIVKQFIFGIPSSGNPSHVGLTKLSPRMRFGALLLGLYGIGTAPLLFGWYLALKASSILVSDAVLEARKKIAQTSPSDAAWDSEVVPATIELLKETLPALSAGFGDGVLVLFFAFWVNALGSFAKFLHSGFPGMLFATAAMSMAPLLLAADVAAASSDCDHVRSTLNDKRAEDMSIETDTKIQIVERLLSNANRGQGLGFVAGGRVIDRATLKNVAVAVSGTARRNNYPLFTRTPFP